uniref:Uncharacterized protein n=1 Tax=Physcomitrium patens TaxID=3218 RepID=A0A2K1K5V7_PHYPA|nr:hypothetical protein PHYPA_011059 [Physcomitrium patens]
MKSFDSSKVLLVMTSIRRGASACFSGYLDLKYSFMSTQSSWYPPAISVSKFPSLHNWMQYHIPNWKA